MAPTPRLQGECNDCKEWSKALSRKGLCKECSYKRILKAGEEMHDKKGPAWEKHKEGIRNYAKSLEVD